MSFICPSPPPAPDYAAAARDQGAANVETAVQSGYLNNPNLWGPGGNQITTFDPGTHQPTVVSNLSPEQQAIYDMHQNTLKNVSGQLEHYGPNAIGDALSTPFNLTGTPSFGINKPPPMQYGIGETPPVQGGLDFSKLPGMPQADASVRDQVAQSLYSQGARFLDRRFGEAQNNLDTRLSNQGIFGGSTAYDRGQGALSDERLRAYGDLGDRAVTAGGDAMSQLYQMAMGARQQGASETTTQGEFANSAQKQVVDQLLSQMTSGNAAKTGQANIDFSNAALHNSGREQMLNELITSKTLPVNIVNSILTQQQLQGQPSSTYNPSPIAPPPIYQAATDTGKSTIDRFNAQQGATSNYLNAGARIGAAMISDRRLKSDIKPIARTDTGLTVYSFTIHGMPSVGVMADEVEKVMPEAVHVGTDGYKRVNYRMLGLR